MTVRNTNIKTLNVDRVIRDSIQTGTIPTGVTASDSKYPLNISDVTYGNPNGTPSFYPLYPVDQVSEDYTIKVTGDWSNSVKTGDPIMIKRGNVKNLYTVRKSVYDSVTNKDTITLFSSRDDVKSLDAFLGSTGYPLTANDTFVLFNKGVESPNNRNQLLRAFDYKMSPTDSDTFSLNISWDIDPTVKATRLRWRTAPRVEHKSTLNFSITTNGDYKDVPSVKLISNSGRSANVILKSSITGAYIAPASGGTGYTTAGIVLSGGGGTGASLSPNIISGKIVSVSVLATGSGYTSYPEITITGNGIGATIDYLLFEVNDIVCTDQGGDYLSPPEIVVDQTSLLMPSSEVVINCALSLANTGSVDYIRVLNGGSGYTGASVSITGSSTSQNATATATIVNGSITSVKVLDGGRGYTGASASIIPVGLSGSGAIITANVDLYSNWVYEDILYTEKKKVISGFKTNLPYEIQIITSPDEMFRGLVKYSDSYTFQYVK